MNTHRESVLLSIVSVLTSANVAGGRIFRSRSNAMAANELPAIVLRAGNESVDNSNRTYSIRNFDVELEIVVRGEPADQLADPIVAAASAAILADQSLGNTIYRIVESSIGAPELADGNGTTGLVRVTYTATYATRLNDNTTHIPILG